MPFILGSMYTEGVDSRIVKCSMAGRCEATCIWELECAIWNWAGFMMTSSKGNIFRVTGHLSGKFTGPGEFPAQRPVTRSFDVFFDLRLNKRFSKQSWGWRFETLSRPLWRHCNVDCVRCQSRELPFNIKTVLSGIGGIPSWGSDGFEKFDRRLGRSCACTSITELIKKKHYRIYVIKDFAHEWWAIYCCFKWSWP